MPLSNKISSIYIRKDGYTTSDSKFRFTTNNFTSELGQVNYNSAYDEAIDASLRTNIRGFRLNVTLDWQKLHDSTVEVTFTS